MNHLNFSIVDLNFIYVIHIFPVFCSAYVGKNIKKEFYWTNQLYKSNKLSESSTSLDDFSKCSIKILNTFLKTSGHLYSNVIQIIRDAPHCPMFIINNFLHLCKYKHKYLLVKLQSHVEYRSPSNMHINYPMCISHVCNHFSQHYVLH